MVAPKRLNCVNPIKAIMNPTRKEMRVTMGRASAPTSWTKTMKSRQRVWLLPMTMRPILKVNSPRKLNTSLQPLKKSTTLCPREVRGGGSLGSSIVSCSNFLFESKSNCWRLGGRSLISKVIFLRRHKLSHFIRNANRLVSQSSRFLVWSLMIFSLSSAVTIFSISSKFWKPSVARQCPLRVSKAVSSEIFWNSILLFIWGEGVMWEGMENFEITF